MVEVSTACMQEHVTAALRHALTVPEQMDHWDAATLGAKDHELIDDALSAVTDLPKIGPPSRPILELTRVNGLPRQMSDYLRTVMQVNESPPSDSGRRESCRKSG